MCLYCRSIEKIERQLHIHTHSNMETEGAGFFTWCQMQTGKYNYWSYILTLPQDTVRQTDFWRGRQVDK